MNDLIRKIIGQEKFYSKKKNFSVNSVILKLAHNITD